jgi:putative transposase
VTAVTLFDICAILGGKYSWLRVRSVREDWPFEAERLGIRGASTQKKFTVSGLPSDIRDRVEYALRQAEALRQELREDAVEALAPEAIRRVSVVKEFLSWSSGRSGPQRVLSEEFVTESNLGLSAKTLSRLVARFRLGGTGALAPKPRAGRPREGWSDEARRALMELYLTENCPTGKACISRVRALAKEKGWKVPSGRTMQRELQRIPEHVRSFYRDGKKTFEQSVLPTRVRGYCSLVPNSVWCGDHMQADVAVLTEKGKVVFPWLTMWMDVRSRKPMGWNLGETPSSRTINQALKRGVNDNGVPDALYIDNGADYSSKMLAGGVRRFRCLSAEEQEELTGIYMQVGVNEIKFAIPGTPRSKPIERFFKTLQDDFLRNLPGYRGNCPGNRPETVDEDIKAGRVLTWKQFEDRLDEWLAAYSTRPHYGDAMDGATPKAVWSTYFEQYPLRRIAPSSLRLLFQPHDLVKVGKQGVRVFNQFYWHEQVAMRWKQLVMVKYDPDDLNFVDCYDLAGTYIARASLRTKVGFFSTAEYEQHEKDRKRLKALQKAERELYKKSDVRRPSALSVELAARPEVVEESFQPPQVTELVRTSFDGVEPGKEKRIREEKPSVVASLEAKRSGGRLTADARREMDESFMNAMLERVEATRRKGGKTSIEAV